MIIDMHDLRTYAERAGMEKGIDHYWIASETDLYDFAMMIAERQKRQMLEEEKQ